MLGEKLRPERPERRSSELIFQCHAGIAWLAIDGGAGGLYAGVVLLVEQIIDIELGTQLWRKFVTCHQVEDGIRILFHTIGSVTTGADFALPVKAATDGTVQLSRL